MMSSQPGKGAVPVALGETTLTGFSRLPAELRIMIWKEFVRIPRIICIGWFDGVRVMGVDRRFSIEIDGRTREQTCPLLRVNRESRRVALGEPLLLFSLKRLNILGIGIEKRNIRHFGIRSWDALYFEDPETFLQHLAGEGDSDKIANIILSYSNDIHRSGAKSCWDSMIWEGVVLARHLRNVQCLEKIYCLIRDVWTRPKKPQLPPSELNDLRDFDPSQFLPAGEWLSNYRKFHQELPESLYAWHSYPERREQILAVLTRWKKVSLDDGNGYHESGW
ncbi:hypothetical protein FHL15_010107 [Xylaria flabelliformis]|uniref:2EXR domain-containing protein n=1 Tax=Xylaria flabelliformis TaxID=2512241 RepID=A0A553HM01_9PEZI|nr:hypothetical protein FHL15_010107 [Xylaria flabelliformis]